MITEPTIQPVDHKAAIQRWREIAEKLLALDDIDGAMFAQTMVTTHERWEAEDA